MTQLRFYAVTELPQSLEANAFYFVENGDYAESYLTSTTGTPRLVGNTLMIGELIAQEMGNWSGESSQVSIVADISSRNALAVGTETNIMALVLDATADTTVTSGSALYAYSVSSEEWYKLSEYESMDVEVKWADIKNKPTSTTAQIDAAVDNAHTHSNRTALDKIGEDLQGNLTYGGQSVKTSWQTKNW